MWGTDQVAGRFEMGCKDERQKEHNPVGVGVRRGKTQGRRSTGSRQPWALGSNPVGIQARPDIVCVFLGSRCPHRASFSTSPAVCALSLTRCFHYALVHQCFLSNKRPFTSLGTLACWAHTRPWWTTGYPPRVEVPLSITTFNPVAEWRSR